MTGHGAYRPGLLPGRRTLVSDVDGTLLAGEAPGPGAAELGRRLREADAALVLSSGRDLRLSRQAAAILERAGMPTPSGLVCGVGTEVYLFEDGEHVLDHDWQARLAAAGFDDGAVRAALEGLAGLTAQPGAAQARFKVSYFVSRGAGSVVEEAGSALGDAGLAANLVFSAGRYLDVLPSAASKGSALLYLAERFGLVGHDVVVAGDSGNDRELLLSAARSGMVAVLVGNHEPEMADMRGVAGVVLANGEHCNGVAEGLDVAGW